MYKNCKKNFYDSCDQVIDPSQGYIAWVIDAKIYNKYSFENEFPDYPLTQYPHRGYQHNDCNRMSLIDVIHNKDFNKFLLLLKDDIEYTSDDHVYLEFRRQTHDSYTGRKFTFGTSSKRKYLNLMVMNSTVIKILFWCF